MDNSERYHFSDFTRANYRHLLRLAQQTYTFRMYTDFNRDERFILWRHDVDFSVHAARKLAQIEVEEGVRATYFLNLHSEFYNLLELEITDCVRDIMELGHTIGLHFDSRYYRNQNEEELEYSLKQEKMFLEEFFGHEICVFSFHNPTPLTMGYSQWKLAGLINTSAEYFRSHVAYCSDSNGYWRFRRLYDILSEAKDERLQVLTHPEWWQEKVMSPRERVHRCINGRAEKTNELYELILIESGRKNLDWE
jgi:hypothetical protein